MIKAALKLSAPLALLFAEFSLACTYDEYLLSFENQEVLIEEFLATSGASIEQLDGYFVETVYQNCDILDRINYARFLVSGGEVVYLENSIFFEDIRAANDSLGKILSYLLDHYQIDWHDSTGEIDGNIRGEIYKLIDDDRNITVNLSVIFEDDFEEVVLYLESYYGLEHPLMKEGQ